MDLTRGPVTRQIVFFSLPMLIGNILQQTYNMADSMMVGRFVGGHALGAVGTAGVIMSFMLAVMMGLTTGASVLISQFFGSRQDEELRRTVSTSLVFMSVLAAAVSVGGILAAPLFLRMLDVPADIFPETLEYLRIILAGMLFNMVYNVFAAFLRAVGNTKVPLYILTLSTILNVVLDIFFVAVFRWGVAGVAYSTIIAQAVSAVYCWAYTAKHVPLLRVTSLSFDKALFPAILRYSVPAAIQLSLTSFASLTIMRLVNSFGSVAAAGYTAAVKIDQFAMMPLSNLSAALSTFAAQNMGAGFEGRAKSGLRAGLGIMSGLAVVLSTAIVLLRGSLMALFVKSAETDAAAIIGVGSRYLAILGGFYILFAIFFAFNGFFRGVGDAVVVMAMTIFSLTVRSVCAHLLVGLGGLGVEAVAWAIPVGWGLSSIFCAFYYKRRLWAGKTAAKIMEETLENQAAECGG